VSDLRAPGLRCEWPQDADGDVLRKLESGGFGNAWISLTGRASGLPHVAFP
jgi:hypothetical protein